MQNKSDVLTNMYFNKVIILAQIADFILNHVSMRDLKESIHMYAYFLTHTYFVRLYASEGSWLI